MKIQCLKEFFKILVILKIFCMIMMKISIGGNCLRMDVQESALPPTSVLKHCNQLSNPNVLYERCRWAARHMEHMPLTEFQETSKTNGHKRVFVMKEILFLTFFFFGGSGSEFDPTAHPNWNLLSHDICGHVDSFRIIGGQVAPMNAYPWLVRIGYIASNNPENVLFRCGGVLVNPNTVITAAHCVTNLPPRQKVNIIRLGEHHTETDPDCENDFCADPVLDVYPHEIITPMKYNIIPLKHDIAIIRLKTKIRFTAFIKPICLVSGKIYKKNLVGSTGIVAGWGIYNINNPKPSTELLVVKLPIVDNSVCIKYFPKSSQIGDTQLCIGGEIGRDSCGGDSGGPVMTVDDSSGEPRYYVLGVVSFGSKRCGKTEAPGVYTKIASYMKWILDNLNKTTDNANVVF